MGRTGIFTCNHCGRDFKRKYTLKRHIEAIHINNAPTKKPTKRSSKCPYCSFYTHNCIRINDHLRSDHKIDLHEAELFFESDDEFNRWKEEIERNTRSFFTIRTTTRENRSNPGSEIVYYKCNRSGFCNEKRSTGKRSRRVQGSCKTGVYCAAQIKRYNNANGKMKVIYCDVHTGHAHEMCYLKLPKSVETLIAKKLQDGTSLDQLLSEIRDEAVSSEILEKKHLITRKTLYNIINKYNLNSVVKYNDDDMSGIDALYEKCESMDSNPILMYKKIDEPFGALCNEDMMLVIITDEQREMLRKFGHDIICIDSTFNSEKLKLQLTSVFILDEFEVAFPACYCISNKVDENTITVLFQEIKKLVGVIEAKAFMSDDEPLYYNSWKNVMTEAKNQIVCKWYIDRAWRKSLDKLGNKETKHEIYTTLRTLLDEPNKQVFEYSLRNFLRKLDEEGFHEFAEFFTTTYAKRPQVWAACYREEAFLNTSMALEASHKALKYLYWKSCKENRIDVVINILLKTIRDKTFKRMINLNEGHANIYANDILVRHDRARHVKSITEIDEQQWSVKSLSKNVKHSVRKIADSCPCQQKCLVCKLCVHMYSCTCNDYFISRNLCKHIHGVARFLNLNDSLPTSISHEIPNSYEVYITEYQDDSADEQIKDEPPPVVYSEEDLFTNQLLQIRDLWNDGNGVKVKNSENMNRLRELAVEMYNILVDEERCPNSIDESITEEISLDQTCVPVLPFERKSSPSFNSNLETLIQTTVYDDTDVQLCISTTTSDYNSFQS
ncbi:uncharacterized protein LOC135833443 [Planococcus citri]|uniref:uncharacterized protein LOC135833443 n=1 Tax=Planococcus citri TaxID=170843 RepID=UPI0031F98BEE